MAMKAQDYVNQSVSTTKTAVNSLQQAINMAEKSENKTKIQQAIQSLNSACSCLSNYQD